MNELLKQKLTKLPVEPGVYFHKNAAGEIIYVGKAAVLKNRVRQYFQKSHKDPKTEALVREIAGYRDGCIVFGVRNDQALHAKMEYPFARR